MYIESILFDWFFQGAEINNKNKCDYIFTCVSNENRFHKLLFSNTLFIVDRIDILIDIKIDILIELMWI